VLGTRIPVYDIGGTWWRRGIMEPDDSLSAVEIRPSISVQRTPHASGRDLQDSLVRHLIDDMRALRDTGRIEADAVAICLGAAINEKSGVAVGSAPMWGPGAPDFDLAAELHTHAPEYEWIVVNDVTALALFHASSLPRARVHRLAALTISTGIALRTLDLATGLVPCDTVHGLQGEIGHLPARFESHGVALHLPCDCGEMDHVSSFCSGPGMERTLAMLANRRQGRGLPPVPGSTKDLIQGVSDGCHEAHQTLDAITKPLARILLNHAALDPQVELTFLSGGVVQAFGEVYRESLLSNMSDLGLYQVTNRDPDYFKRRISIACADPLAGMRGAGLRARAVTANRRAKRETAWVVNTLQPVSYSVQYTPDVLAPENKALAEAAQFNPRSPAVRIAVVDATVAALYGAQICDYFDGYGVPLRLVKMATSEASKSPSAVEFLVREFDAVGLSRRDEPVVAIGGGVLTDIVGLATSLYRRGVPYVRIPTTLIGLVDAGVGVKTAVNFDEHKSRLGSYHAPRCSLLDPGFLETLDKRSISNGLSEILKVALVKDCRLFELLEEHAAHMLSGRFRDCQAGELVIRLAVGNMLEELEPNLWEANLERLVDFGHSFSPAIEMRALPELMHGEAVAIDMVLSCCISVGRGMLSDKHLVRILKVVKACGLGTRHELLDDSSFLAHALIDTTRQRGGAQRLPLLTGIGQAVFVHDVSEFELKQAVEILDEVLSVVRA
jgi:3-dehydroquinate synthetase/predicted NBD/HSP70 family sugar kinase